MFAVPDHENENEKDYDKQKRVFGSWSSQREYRWDHYHSEISKHGYSDPYRGITDADRFPGPQWISE
jgi:hypothetical protein